MKSLTKGLIIPLAVAGAVVAAPTASAAVPSMHHRGHVPCTLTAQPFRGAESGFGRGDRARIKVVLTLRSNTDRAGHNVWRVLIRQNGGPILSVSRRTQDGLLIVVNNARDTYRSDFFTATAANVDTGQRCRAMVVVPEIKI